MEPQSKYNTGVLYLIPKSLCFSDNNEAVLKDINIDIIDELDEFIVEDIRTARRYLKAIGYKKSLDKIIFHVLDKHTAPEDLFDFIEPAVKGKNIGLLSEAGCPCVADPGAEIVKIAHSNKIKVMPLVGPSSIILALMASGFNGQNFAFVGYLPIDKYSRVKAIKNVEKDAYQKNQTQIFIETPYRNNKLLEDILKTCDNKTLLCIASDITMKDEFIVSKSVDEWKKQIPDLNKKPTVFLLYK